ncbi:MAG: hypothetical protein WCG28_03960 [bacterium]
MMPIFISILLVAIVVAVIFFFKSIRDAVVNFLVGGGYYAAGLWARRPTLAQIWAAIRWPIIVGLIGWAMLILILTSIGFYVKAPIAGLVIALLLPVWCILRLLRGLPWVGKFFRYLLPISWWITTTVLVIALVYFLVGVWSPEFKASADRLYANKKLEWANSMDKKSIQSEPESGIFATAKETASVYNDKNIVIQTLRQGEIVMVIQLDGKKEENKEGMTKVRVSNENGDFYTGGKIGWVASRLLEFKNQEEKKAISTSIISQPIQPIIETMQIGIHQFAVKKTTTGWMKIPDNAVWDIASVENGNWKIITFDGQVITYKKEGNKYVNFPEQTSIFKIQTDEELNFIMSIKPRV